MAADNYVNAENRRVEAANGTTFAYRDLSNGEVPIVLLQHFAGTWTTGTPRSSTRSHRTDEW